MLRALRDALAATDGPIRLDVLARQLHTDVGTVSAMLEHPATRTLVGLTPATPADDACAPGCHPTSSNCRHCPVATQGTGRMRDRIRG